MAPSQFHAIGNWQKAIREEVSSKEEKYSQQLTIDPKQMGF